MQVKTRKRNYLKFYVILYAYCVQERKNSAAEKGEGSTNNSKQRRAERHNNILFINL